MGEAGALGRAPGGLIRRSLRAVVLCALLAGSLAGCAGGFSREPSPPDRYFTARVPDFPTARYYGDKPPAAHAFDVDVWARERLPLLRQRAGPGENAMAHLLLLSGGGADGAFGAGVLNGWTAHGTRPDFEIVTGVSIGALMAPFAFLGPEHDPTLRAMFMELEGARDIVNIRIISALTGGPAIGDSSPLRGLIARYVDEALLDQIAQEHATGRRLFVATTNLDAKRPLVWNIGEIAASRREGRVDLVRDVMLASASVPGITPPVLIDVEIDGARYQELHVDGGVMNSVFLSAPFLSGQDVRDRFEDIEATFWIIQNNKLRGDYQPIQRNLGRIVSGTISELIRTQARGDQERLYFLAQREKIRYRLAAVPTAFKAPGGDEFAPDYLRRLYALGERLARPGYPWRLAPPSLDRLQLGDPEDGEFLRREDVEVDPNERGGVVEGLSVR